MAASFRVTIVRMPAMNCLTDGKGRFGNLNRKCARQKKVLPFGDQGFIWEQQGSITGSINSITGITWNNISKAIESTDIIVR